MYFINLLMNLVMYLWIYFILYLYVFVIVVEKVYYEWLLGLDMDNSMCGLFSVMVKCDIRYGKYIKCIMMYKVMWGLS